MIVLLFLFCCWFAGEYVSAKDEEQPRASRWSLDGVRYKRHLRGRVDDSINYLVGEKVVQGSDYGSMEVTGKIEQGLTSEADPKKKCDDDDDINEISSLASLSNANTIDPRRYYQLIITTFFY